MATKKQKTYRISGSLTVTVHASVTFPLDPNLHIDDDGKPHISEEEAKNLYLYDALIQRLLGGDFEADEDDVEVDEFVPVKAKGKRDGN